MAWMPSFFALMRFFYIKIRSLSCFLAVGFCLLIRTLLYAFSICEYGDEIRYSLETIFFALMRFFYIKICSLSCFLAVGFCLLIRTLLYAFSICEYGDEIRYSLETIFFALMRFFYIRICSLSCFLAIVGLGYFSLYANLSSSLSFNRATISLYKLKLS